MALSAAMAGTPETAAAGCPTPTCAPPIVIYELSVTFQGSGTVTDHNDNSCSSATQPCSFAYPEGTNVTLTATGAAPEWRFQGWSGTCSGTGTCQIVMDGPKSETATFVDPPPAPPTITSPAEGAVVPSTTGSVYVAFSAAPDTTVVGYRCSVDGGPVTDCSPPGFATAGLPTGLHDVEVASRDSNGQLTTRSVSFHVVNRPDTTITGTPGAGAVTTATTTNFGFTSPTAGVTFECSVNGAGWVPCATDQGPVRDGTHALHARAVVTYQGTPYPDTSPAVVKWTVDTTGPTVSITSGPEDGSSSTSRGADFRFATSEGTLECSLDGAAFGPCPGPAADQAAYTGLGVGRHTFSVRAVDALGNVGAAATRAWTVTAPPGSAGAGGDTGGSPARIKAKLASRWLTTKKGTRALKLRVTAVPAGAKIQVICKSKARTCPFKKKSVVAKGGKADLVKLLKKRLLQKGDILEIRITKAGLKAQVLRFTMRPPKQPKKTTA